MEVKYFARMTAKYILKWELMYIEVFEDSSHKHKVISFCQAIS